MYATAVVASGAGAVPSNAKGPLPDDAIDHSEQVGAPHAPRHEGVLSRQREGRTVFSGAPLPILPLAILSALPLPTPDAVGRPFVFEPERPQASVAPVSHRTSRGPPLLAV